MGDAGDTVFINQMPRAKPLDAEGFCQWMGMVVGDGGCEDVSRSWRRLEPSCAPAAIYVQAFHLGLANDRAGVRAGVYDAGPLAVESPQVS